MRRLICRFHTIYKAGKNRMISINCGDRLQLNDPAYSGFKKEIMHYDWRVGV